ncbi:type IV secretory system conjugative DNA transfer family protein [Streptomyces sp. NBC_00841]|uniref:type IV secretory system conjugative DNA transfer family protein n=1 Tax=unclassified Streptomyces TaxID=2593676 RepID=UPI0022532800|nr:MULTISPECIES: type IV secretory system conjugative DNA transfer family protein [unclassified Streptomyces]MCX4533750.1 type IV secretory system conjugative DNA transfer family protein [Streptomyces sp. NBC_01669]WSA00853.1 type IV secretory system conjugative DNA transfer family protein [Streptomyces sp. NBC_00841]
MAGRTEQQTGPSTGGIPDGLLVGLLGFLLGLALLAWTATGLSGLFTHGAWPKGVTFTETPLAMRRLAAAPHDIPAAWPDTPADELSGYGLFWGLFIGELMVLMVLTVFVMGVVARWRAVRARRREERREERYARHAAHPKREEPAGVEVSAPAPLPTPAPAPAPPATTTPATPAPATPATATPAPAESAEDPAPPLLVPAVPSPRTPLVVYGPAATRRPTVVQAIREADGPALVITSDPTVWAETKDARAKLGPVLVYDPGHLCDTPARLHWSPTAGCEQPDTAAARAAALLAPVRPQARIDAMTAETAETLLQCWLHAAAIDGRPFRQVHRWALGGNAHEPVRLLRTHPKAASGLAGLLESALTGHPERREMAQELTVRAFAALSSVHIREACTPNRADSLVLESFAGEGGTLYVVGESIEDPRSTPGAMPLLTALASHVVEHGRRMAARSTDGRLDPPMALVLDDVAAVAPLPQLPELLSTGQDQGLPTLVLLRSKEQARARWSSPL